MCKPKESIIAGRTAIYIPDHPKANNRGYVLKYRYVMEQHIGRFLNSSEEVHHINGDKRDDRIENLQIVSKPSHAKIHKLWESGGNRRTHNWNHIKSLYESGLGCRRISKIINCHKTAVQYACKQMGLTRKTTQN